MKRAICPITKKVMDCKVCKVPKRVKCPYNKFDDCIEYALEFCRKIVDAEVEK